MDGWMDGSIYACMCVCIYAWNVHAVSPEAWKSVPFSRPKIESKVKKQNNFWYKYNIYVSYKCNIYTRFSKTLLTITSHEQEFVNWMNLVSISLELCDFRFTSSRWTTFSTHVPSPTKHETLRSPLWHTTWTWWRFKYLKKQGNIQLVRI